MTHFLLLHSDPALRRALAATLEAAWPGITCAHDAPDAPLATIGAATLLISAEKPDAVPEERFFRLPAEKGPIRLPTLIRQLEILLRQNAVPALLPFGTAALDTRNREWNYDGHIVSLTEKEVAILVYLWQASAPITREDLLRDVWEYATDADTHTVETHIYRLRQKIERDPANPEHVLTLKTGYQLAARSSA